MGWLWFVLLIASTYDARGRLVSTVDRLGGGTVLSDDFAGSETPLTDPAVTTEEALTYLDGTELVASRTRAGETTEYVYDYRHRVVETRVQPNAGTTLVSRQKYVDNELFSTADPYGRQTFYAYDATDGRLIRTIQATEASVDYADFVAVLAAVRVPATTANPTALITDILYDAEGQPTSTIDSQGLVSTVEYDTIGRTIRSIQAAAVLGGGPAAAPALTETVYDAASQPIEVRSPGYFDANDTGSLGQSKTLLTYTGRGLVKSVAVAPGTPVAASESYAYNLKGQLTDRTDARGQLWKSLHRLCCGQVNGSIRPDGHGTLAQSDPLGNVFHVALLSDVASHPNSSNPDDAKTLSEITARYDERDRPVARTIWLSPRGAVAAHDPPIAGDNGIPATDGLTTRWKYDDDATDGSGLDQEFSAHFAGLNLGAGANGSATLVTNPVGERTLTVQDGLGRTLRSVRLSSTGTALAQVTSVFDERVTIAGYGSVQQVSVSNGLGQTARGRVDGAGRLLEQIDAENHSTRFEYNAGGQRTKVRDPNGVGVEATFDALGRVLSSTDTHGDGVSQQYNVAGNVIGRTDAKQQTSTLTYDARGRLVSTTDRLGGGTVLSYDAAGLLVSLRDAEQQTTAYLYDSVGRRTKETYPDGGARHFAYDDAGRVKSVTDQAGVGVTQVYDFAGRRTRREYRAAGVDPTGPPTDADLFTFDAASRMLTAIKGRYANTVTRTYDDGGRLATESLTTFGQTYAVAQEYDAAGRLNRTTLPDGKLVEQTFTPRGQLASLAYDGQSLETREYDAGRRLVTQESVKSGAANVVSTRTYREDSLLASLTRPNVAGLSFTYNWDANKNKTAEIASDLMQGFGFTVPTAQGSTGG